MKDKHDKDDERKEEGMPDTSDVGRDQEGSLGGEVEYDPDLEKDDAIDFEDYGDEAGR
jgi:hypothetical protein